VGCIDFGVYMPIAHVLAHAKTDLLASLSFTIQAGVRHELDIDGAVFYQSRISHLVFTWSDS
jgi:hypothetical protein